MAVFHDVSKEKLFVYPPKIEWKEGKVPVAQKADFRVVSFPAVEPLKEELKHFGECVRWSAFGQADFRGRHACPIILD